MDAETGCGKRSHVQMTGNMEASQQHATEVRIAQDRTAKRPRLSERTDVAPFTAYGNIQPPEALGSMDATSSAVFDTGSIPWTLRAPLTPFTPVFPQLQACEAEGDSMMKETGTSPVPHQWRDGLKVHQRNVVLDDIPHFALPAMLAPAQIPAYDHGMQKGVSNEMAALYKHVRKLDRPAQAENKQTGKPQMFAKSAEDFASAASRWNKIQSSLWPFLSTCLTSSTPEEFSDYIAVLQIAALYVDDLCNQSGGWQAKVVIAHALDSLSKCIRDRWKYWALPSPYEKQERRRQCQAAISAALLGFVNGDLGNAHALSARFIRLIVDLYGKGLGKERLREADKTELYLGRFTLGITREIKKADEWLKQGRYSDLSCANLAAAYLSGGKQSELVTCISNDLSSIALTDFAVMRLMMAPGAVGRPMQAATLLGVASTPSLTTNITASAVGENAYLQGQSVLGAAPPEKSD